ncbi:hypothetical protein Tsp_09805 [Trichinella spiralis]|uniref:hypothetical protein n=1 Tax=Trichinella spiralis TaxID=6334 RepID=UPI0001EFD7E8|nr:hypothetical protein Tsp_09805 [Trichinella spiralis]
MCYCFKSEVTKLQTIKIKIDKLHRKQNRLGCSTPQQFIKGMFDFRMFNCEFVKRFQYVIRMAAVIQWIAMVVAILYLILLYRKAKNTDWRRRREIRHNQVLKDIGCFKSVPLRFYSKVPSGEYRCGRNAQQMACKKIVAVRRDSPLNRIMVQMKPVIISRENRNVPPTDDTIARHLHSVEKVQVIQKNNTMNDERIVQQMYITYEATGWFACPTEKMHAYGTFIVHLLQEGARLDSSTEPTVFAS